MQQCIPVLTIIFPTFYDKINIAITEGEIRTKKKDQKMIEIFKTKKLTFFYRIINKIGLSVAFPLIILIIYLSTKMYYLPLTNPLFYVFPIYWIYFFYSNLLMAKTYIQNIVYYEKEDRFEFVVFEISKKKVYKIPKKDLVTEILTYGAVSRTYRQYLKITDIKNNFFFKQYDYGAWSTKTMKIIIEKIHFSQATFSIDKDES